VPDTLILFRRSAEKTLQSRGGRSGSLGTVVVDYIRFVVLRTDENSGCGQGLFQALGDLECAGTLLPDEKQAHDEIYRWFRVHLKVPASFTRSRKPHAKEVAISWFKSTAVEHIRQMRLLAQILEMHGVHVKMLRTERPGYIVYEDEFQVAAQPFKNTVT
jgi:hypothetical protein